MILIESLLAPTVPSEPRPQNLQAELPSADVTGFSTLGSERFVTSSVIESVNPLTGSLASRFLYVAMISAGIVSFEPRPYLPPMICGAFALPA